MQIRITTFFHRNCILLALLVASAQATAVVDVAIVINPYAGDRAGPEIDGDALAMTKGGMAAVIESAGGRIVRTRTVTLTEQDEAQYGRWNRFGLASGHLAGMATENFNAGLLNLGLYNNCSSLMGMLGGLRHASLAGVAGPQRIGLVWIDAHGDYNTPVAWAEAASSASTMQLRMRRAFWLPGR